MTLTPQEVAEADALFALWQKTKQQESDLERFEKDMGEIVLNCYVEGSQASPTELQDVVAVFRQMEAEIDSFLATAPAGLERRGIYVYCDRQTANRLYGGLAQMDQRMLQILLHNSNVSSVMPVMIALWQARQPLLVEGLANFLQKLAKRTENLPFIWRQAQRTIRKAMQERVREFRAFRSSTYDALCVWAAGSSERALYLKDKGICIPAKGICLSSNVKINNGAGSICFSRRRQKQKTSIALSGALAKPSCNGYDKPWKIICVNAQSTQLCSFSLKLSDDGSQLAETLDLCYDWQMPANRTMLALAKLLKAEPSKRNNVPWIPFRGINWYRLRVSRKYRILAHVKDGSRTVLLMAGHRTKLYADIGKLKNES